MSNGHATVTRRVSPLLAMSIALCAGCGEPPERERPPERDGVACVAEVSRGAGLVVAGTGALIPLAEGLAEIHGAEGTATPVRVAESIGTGGALRAIRDGAIDVALAGRRVDPEELAASGLRAVPLAGAITAFAASKRHAATLDVPELIALFSGERTRWPNGARVVPLVREEGDSATEAVRDTFPALYAAMIDARDSGRALVQPTDKEMEEALLHIDGAVGLIEIGVVRLGQLDLGLAPLGGVEPSPEAARDGRYPLVRRTWLVVRDDASNAVEAFLDALASPEAAELLERGGYLAP
jgi:phosphate transport system substrate-binding protein